MSRRTEWRFLRGWSEAELERALEERRGRPLNFDPEAPRPAAEGWRRNVAETTVAREPPGPPTEGGAFERIWQAVTRYEFSDPRIVTGHFDPSEPLEGRTMLLELKALGLRFLCATRVRATRRDRSDHETVFGYRYDTLVGHVESGWEWFLVTKSHATGEIRFGVAAEWRPGDFPNWWSRLGFRVLGPGYQRRWVRRAHQRLRRIAAERPPVPVPRARLLHEGAEEPERNEESA